MSIAIKLKIGEYQKHIESEILSLLYILTLSIILHIFIISDLIKTFLALPAFLIIPYQFGRSIIYTLNLNKNINSFDVVSRFIILWIFGVYTILILTQMIWFLIRSAMFICIAILVAIATPNIVKFTLFKNIKKSFNHRYLKISDHSDSILITFIIIVFSITPLLIYKSIQPYPLHGSHSYFNFNKETLEFINGESFNIALRQAYFPIQQLLVGLLSVVYNFDPFSIYYSLPFLFYITYAFGLYAFSYQVLRNKYVSLLSAFVGLWLMHSIFYKYIYMTVPRSWLHAMSPWLIYLVQKNILRENTKDKFSFGYTILSILAVAIVTFFIRVSINPFRIYLHILFFSFMFILFIYLLKKNKKIFLTILITIFIILLHTYEGCLLLIMIIAYITFFYIYRVLFISNKIKNISKILIVTIVFIFISSQSLGLLTFNDNFVISKYLFGEKWTGSQADVNFNMKYERMVEANTYLMFIFFFLSILLGLIKIEIVPISLANLVGMFIYFLPEGFTQRASYLLPFFPIVLSYGIFYIINILKINKNNKILSSIILFVILIIFLPSIFTPFYNEIKYYYSRNTYKSVFEKYEYDTAVWIKNNLPKDTLVLSDPFTTQIIVGVSDRYSYIAHRWKFEKEYYIEDLERIRSLKYKFFLSNNSTESFIFAHNLRNLLSVNYSIKTLYYLHNNTEYIIGPVNKISPNATIIVVISPRTSKWLEQRGYFGYFDKISPRESVNLSLFKSILDNKYFELIKIVDNKVYIFRVKEIYEIRR